jgi:diguanylate cyclase (GGDEF)-like protein
MMIPTSAMARLYPPAPSEANPRFRQVLTRHAYDEAMAKEGSSFTGVELGLEDENALLRASLADAQERLQEMERSADADALTGLPNHRSFVRELKRAVGQAGRHGMPAAVLSIDLRGLQAINDRHGRLAGDSALIHVAKILGGLIRSTDVLARVRGGAFGLILDHLDQNSAIETAERLARCISSSPVDLGGTRVSVEATIATTGILAGDSFEDVLARTERNLAYAKSGD